ncbi:MAG: hypothetical protein IPO36_21605 [Anaerolineales bacterium]|nr:hypothetical protein [Anaerolineales bacterium]
MKQARAKTRLDLYGHSNAAPEWAGTIKVLRAHPELASILIIALHRPCHAQIVNCLEAGATNI